MKIKKKQAAELKNWAKALAEASGRKTKEVMDELTKELKTIIKKPVLKSFEDDAKVEHALRILKATHTTPLVRRGREMELLVLDFTKPRRITPKDKSKEPYDRADIYGLGVCIDEDATDSEQELKYFSLVMFDDNTKLVEEVERGMTYKAQCTLDLVKGIFELGAIEGLTHFKESEEQMDANPDEVLQELFKVVPIADAEFNVCNKKVRSDMRLIRGDVTYAAVMTSQSGYTYGRFVCIDDSLDIEDIKKHGGLSIMVDKSQVLYAEGSSLLFLGQIDKDDEGRVGMTANVIVPIIPIPREQVEEVDDEEEDEPLDDESEVDLSGDEEEEEQDSEEVDDDDEELEAEEEEEEEKPKPKKKDKKKPTKKPKKEDDDDDDDGGMIDLGED